MPKVCYCSNCSKYALQHPRSVSKKCQLEGGSLAGDVAGDVEVSAPPHLPLPDIVTAAGTGRQDRFHGQEGAED